VDPQKACRTTGNTSTCGKYAQELYAAIVPDGSRRKQRFICKNLLKFFGTSRILCCFYADPVAPMQLNLKPLKMLTHEMKNVINLLSPVDAHVEPATTLDDMEMRLKQFSPQIVMWSGHALGDSIAFEKRNGRIDLPPAAQLQKAFNKELKILAIIACGSSNVLKTLEFLPGVIGIGFEFVVEDSAAKVFVQGMMNKIKLLIDGFIRIDGNQVFEAGLESFLEAGYKSGDPSEYLHPPGHPHTYRPVLDGSCEGCTPPVHGKPFIIHY
tara:strand:- start:165 stop:968 length:804 start_codon:yes stop_codon:yes gene_type:complete